MSTESDSHIFGFVNYVKQLAKEISRQFVSQSEVSNTIHSRFARGRFPALGKSDTYLLGSDWFVGLSLSFVMVFIHKL